MQPIHTIFETAERNTTPALSLNGMPLRDRIRDALQLTALAVLIVAGTSRRASELEQLTNAAERARTRPTTARLAGFPWAPPSAAMRSGAAASDPPILAAAAGLVERPQNDRASALALLLTGRRQEAVAALEALANSAARDASVWNDLAAARYELATASGNEMLVGPALAAADEALRIDPTNPAAAFNRALILERLGLYAAAARGFEKAAVSDADSRWGKEAHDRRTRVAPAAEAEEWAREKQRLERGEDVAAIVRRFPQQARVTAEGDYLARWADAFMEGRRDAALRWLEVSRDVGQALMTTNGEALLSESVRAIEEARDASRLARAHRLYRDARIRYSTSERRIEEALPLFQEAAREFTPDGSPMRFVAAYYAANASFDAHRIAEAMTMVQDLGSRVPARFAALRAQILWMDATLSAHAGEPYRALQKSTEAADRFSHLGERENAARMRMAAAVNLRTLGRNLEAHRTRAAAFEAASQAGKPSMLLAFLNAAARDEVRDRRWDVAASLFGLVQEFGAQSPRVTFDAQLWGAVARARAGRGRLELSPARAALAATADAAMRADMEDELRFVEALELSAPAAGVRLLSECIEYRLARPRHPELVRAFAERARLLRGIGDDTAAETDLRRAIAITEDQRASIDRADLRDTFYGTAARLSEELADLLVEQQRLDEAYEVVAASQTKAFERQREPRGPLDPVPAPTHSAAGTVVLQVAALRTATLLSVITSRGVTHVRVPAGEEQVRTWSQRFVQGIERGAHDETRVAGRALFDLLVAPVGSLLQSGQLMIVVPDPITEAIPFAALQDPQGRFLIEKHALAVAPSSSVAVQRPAARRLALSSLARAVVVADPAFSETTFPGLSRLPAARRDATELTRFLPRAITLTDGDATVGRVLQSAHDARVLHLATHAVPNPVDAWKSLLALAPAGDTDGALYLHDIAEEDLENLELVVLAGCRTAVDGGGSGQVRSLATAFLVAGARDTIASLWDIEDRASSELTREFFRSLVPGTDPTDALRAAQLTMLRSDDPELRSPRTWAALQLFTR